MNAHEKTEIIERAKSAFAVYKKSSRYQRARILAGIAQGLEQRKNDFVRSMVQEAKKPVTLAELEVSRAIQTFTVASEEAKRYGGDVIPLDIDVASQAFLPAVSYFFPKGIILGITPFNFPLNLVAHKVAPALAVGAAIMIKPAPQAPGCALLLKEVFDSVCKTEKFIPYTDTLQVFPCSNEVAEKLVTDPAVAVVSFTGSTKVGFHIQKTAIGKKVLLELGGNAAVIVHEDADLKRAANRVAVGSFVYAGQTCISVQRVFVHQNIFNNFEKNLLEETAKIKTGDTTDPTVTVGPVIDEVAAERIQNWIEDAVKSGATVLTGGKRLQGAKFATILPTVLKNVKTTEKISCEEVFGPVVILDSYSEKQEAIRKVNDSRFGLQAGIFTNDHKFIQQAVQELEVGGVLINEIPTFRADHMPYGGVKESGLGREGLKFAMEEFSERKTVLTWIGA